MPKKTNCKSEQVPKWARKSLQGLTYWIGRRRCLYNAYPLSEGAFVAELCNLIHANLPKGYRLSCEVQYSKFISSPCALFKKARVDLVVGKPLKGGKDKIRPKFIIEVKRAKAQKNIIEEDLRRLAKARQALKEVRAFLFVISEARIPKRFVTEKGMPRREKHQVLDSNPELGYYKF